MSLNRQGSTRSREENMANDLLTLQVKVLGGFLVSFLLMALVVYAITPAFTTHPIPQWLDHWYLAMSR